MTIIPFVRTFSMNSTTLRILNITVSKDSRLTENYLEEIYGSRKIHKQVISMGN